MGWSFQILGRPLVIIQARFWGFWKSKVCVRLCKTNIAVNIYQWFESGKKWALGPCYVGVRRAKKNATDHDDQRRICPSFLVVALVWSQGFLFALFCALVPSPAFSGRPVLYPGHQGSPVLDPGPLHHDLARFTLIDCRVDWYRLHQKCIKPAPGQLGPFRPLIRPRSGARWTAGTMEKGAEYQPHQRGPWRMICNRGPLPLIRLCACSVGAGSVCPAVQDDFLFLILCGIGGGFFFPCPSDLWQFIVQS